MDKARGRPSGTKATRTLIALAIMDEVFINAGGAIQDEG